MWITGPCLHFRLHQPFGCEGEHLANKVSIGVTPALNFSKMMYTEF
jgi:hypothetical protein